MLKLKNLLCCTMSVILMLSLMSCSVVEKLNSHYESDLVIDQTENVSVSETVIKALENNDADAIKNLFSVRAKDLCPDLDEGIGYMLSIYEGEFVEVTQNNSSSNKYSSGGERCIVSPVCVFKTTENYYKLTWNAWTINEKDKEKEGVYSMKLQIWPDAGLDQGGEDLFVAGVVYPANSEESDMAFTLWKNIYQQKNHDDLKLSITLDTFPTRIMKRSVRRQPLRRIFAALQQGEAHQWTSRSCGCSSNS